MARKRPNETSQTSTSSKKRHIEEERGILPSVALPRDILPSNSSDSLRSGKLLRIHLTNFMCHSNLVMEFNNRVNLLIGSNGSGKSAILTALVIGLGARANKTNRSANLKNLIKTGENSATIEIDIANNGADSFDINTYGKVITVERKMLASGGSNYKIKNENGRVISKNRDDLMKILLYHNIQTDNPVFVLNQDAARSFLKDLDPVKNYTLFLKASQMELIFDKLNKCAQIFAECRAKITVGRKQLQVYENEVNELRLKYERLQSVEEIKLTITNLKLERIWLQVIEQENIVKQIQNEIVAKDREKNEIKEKIDGTTGEDEIQRNLRSLQKEVDNQNKTLHKENKVLNDLREKYKQENSKYQSEAQYINKLKERVKHLNNQKTSIENAISERTESCSSRNTQMRQENEQKIERLEKQRSDVTAMVDTLKQELNLNEHNKERQQEEYQAIKMQKIAIDNRISSNQQELNRIASSSNDRIDVYGQHMSSLLQAIERAYKAGKFSAMPKGPLGRYLEVPDRKWRGAVEQFIGNLLTSFVVNSAKDRIMLDNIIKTNFRQARHTLITSQFRDKVYDVQKGSVGNIPGAHLLMNLIKCSDPVVMNCIIDQIHCETILLVEDQELAVRLTSDEYQVPRNLLKVVLLDPFIEYLPAPLFRAYSLNPRNPRYIQVNMNEKKLALQEEIRQNDERRKEFEAKLQDVRKSLGDYEEYQKQKQVLLRKHESTLYSLRMQVEDLSNVEYPSENEDEILRTELIQSEQNLTKTQRQIEEKSSICITLNQSLLEQDNDVKKKQANIRTIEGKLNSLTEELNSKRIDISKLDNNLRVWGLKLKQLEATIVKLKCDCDTEEEKLSDYERKALKIGDRVTSEKSNCELTARIKSLETKIKEICSTGENIDEIRAIYQNKELNLKADKACIDSSTEVLVLLKKSRQHRYKMMKCLQEHMAIRVSHTFKHILKIKNFEGELEVNHLDKTLKMSIVPRDKHIQNAVSSTKSLSGGERSYATVAFLLSLWSCVDHPFYFLDEYDVFTDQFNRQIMTKLLLNEAEKKSHRQYTFLSPQDMSFIQASDAIKIHRLSDPHKENSL